MFRRIVVFAVMLLTLLAVLTVSAQETPEPVTTTYQVRSGDTLGAIAARFGTSVLELMRLNNLSSSELIVIGQTLRIPATMTPGSSTESAPATAVPPLPSGTPAATTPLPPAAAPTQPPPTLAASAFDYGIEAEFTTDNVAGVAQQLTVLGMHWAKIAVSWRHIEAVRGAPDFALLDAAVAALEARGLHILFTVSAAPDWARSSQVENGPPDNFNDFAVFVETLAARYAGRVSAYEIWNEPNLRREWNNPLHPISAASYADLLRAAYGAIKAADPTAQVISAGLAPTGFDDGVNAVNDRRYLTALYASGLAAISDAVGSHPFGFANPPEARCCAAPPGVTTHYGHPSFYFLDTLDDYHAIMLANGDADTLIWITAFGWGTSADMETPPPYNSQYVAVNSLAAQAEYIPHAFELALGTHFVGVTILYNLNSCPARPDNVEACYYSLLGPGGRLRPAYTAVQTIFGTAVER